MATAAYDPQAAVTALDNAASSLRDARKAARDADDAGAGMAAVLDAAVGDLVRRRQQAQGSIAAIAWTPDRAQDALEAAGIPVEGGPDGLTVDLPTSSTAYLRITAAATTFGSQAAGYAVELVAAGETVLRLRAKDDADLVQTVTRLRDRG